MVNLACETHTEAGVAGRERRAVGWLDQLSSIRIYDHLELVTEWY